MKIYNNKQNLTIAALLCLGLSSCSDDFSRSVNADGDKIKVTVPDFNMGEGFEDIQTRTTVDLSNKQYITSWTEGDYIDVFALGDGKFEGTAASESHVKFEITNITEGNEAHARFQGDGYGLLEGYGYAAYYPYKDSDYQSDAVELNYDYSGITITPDATDHISQFDYLVATTQIPEKQTVTLGFEHVGTLVRLTVVCPNGGTYNKIRLMSEEADAFVKKATLNVADGSTIITETADMMDFPISSTTVENNGTVTIYFMAHPKNYKSMVLNVAIYGTSTNWQGTVVGKNFAQGNAESLKVVANKEYFEMRTDEYIDLGLPSGNLWATKNLGATKEIGEKINPVTGALDYFGNHYCFGETNGLNESPTAYPASWTGQKNEDYLALTTRTQYSMSTPQYYKWGNIAAYPSSWWKYNNANDELELEDDAAHVKLGGNWRTPSKADCEELKANCVFMTTTSYMGVAASGIIVYKAKDPSDKGKVTSVTGNPSYLAATYSLDDDHIFIPFGSGGGGSFGSSSPFNLMTRTISSSGMPYNMSFYGSISISSAYLVFQGIPIRPVLYP